ncbi:MULTISPECIES: hypothetical protein [unclassified Synechocystis]|uniref:hypothetical protein n=1 Tax=unclassified Synechocystis TaxID=2640012 RepID=UPI000422E1EE|nr:MULTISPECIES: hypothetical protein [unclassified Synechocystis]AIE75131.1 hypothetical protein D082_26020 [Synechocystis sp. PCC 6714]MCT0252895.1 hypothetical protein [Synechocystis sp. CS-94]
MSEDRFADTKLIRLQLCLYLLPVVGILPSLWQLRQPEQGNGQVFRQRRHVSRRSLQFTLGWLGLYLLLWGAGQGVGELAAFRLMYLNGLITSGYFVVCLIWMGRIFFQPLVAPDKRFVVTKDRSPT